MRAQDRCQGRQHRGGHNPFLLGSLLHHKIPSGSSRILGWRWAASLPREERAICFTGSQVPRLGSHGPFADTGPRSFVPWLSTLVMPGWKG